MTHAHNAQLSLAALILASLGGALRAQTKVTPTTTTVTQQDAAPRFDRSANRGQQSRFGIACDDACSEH
jgi:hypothetical protein